MPIKVGINGFGRISRVIMRIAESRDDIEVVGINIRNADLEYLAYMLRYDSTFGRFPAEVEAIKDGIAIDGRKVAVYSESDASNIDWTDCGAEYIVEATGAYTTTEKAMVHIESGAKKVVISAPAKDKETPTFVMGVNHTEYDPGMKVVSNASCTTNCLAPLAKVIHDNWGIEEGLMSTIHAATAKQKVVDSRSMKDWRTGRSVFGNIIPSTTGAAKAVGKVIPDLAGRLTGISYRVPIEDVSLVDLNIHTEKPTSYGGMCEKIKEAANTYMKGILRYVDDEVVSRDFIGDPCTSIFDARQGIQLNDHFFKVIAFYDNEYGYSAKVLELISYMASKDV